jgi:hypothetical protein
MHPVSLTELERLARECGATVIHTAETPDQMGRPNVTWTGIALRLPDDGTGALPLLRHVILNDQKSATYKLGLLSSAAPPTVRPAREHGENSSVVLPLGLIALDWVRLTNPWLRPVSRRPQSPGCAPRATTQCALYRHIQMCRYRRK